MTPSSKPVILFDLDRTLIDTDKLSKLINGEIANFLSISTDKAKDLFQQYFQESYYDDSTDYDPWSWLSFLSGKFPDFSKEELEAVFFNKAQFEASVFPEVFNVIGKIKKIYRVGIFSQGVIPWQEKKLELAGLAPLFEKELTFIFRRKVAPASLEKLPIGAVVIDDRKVFIEGVIIANRFRPIWINRNSVEKHEAAETIHSLNELPGLLTNKITD